jgi:hypothetical protein
VKAGNNRERIPWVSHHPTLIKRGVYIGECSRLAVLCSTKENYIGAIKDLNLLYVMRGYPEKLVISWCHRYIQERWEKRFSDRNIKVERNESALVLKTRFDDVWNFFSAAELGEAITGYWDEWLERAKQGNWSYNSSRPFLPYKADGHDIVDVHTKMFDTILGEDGDVAFCPSLRKAGLLGSRWIVSRKRTKNLLDLATKWKNMVFDKLDEVITDDIITNDPSQNQSTNINLGPDWDLSLRQFPSVLAAPLQEDTINIHRQSPDGDDYDPTFGRSYKMYTN